MLSVVFLNVKLNVVMLNVVILNAVMLGLIEPKMKKYFFKIFAKMLVLYLSNYQCL